MLQWHLPIPLRLEITGKCNLISRVIPIAGKLSSKCCDRWRRASCNQFHWSRWKRGPVRRQPRYQTKIDEGQSVGAAKLWNARTSSCRRYQLLPRSFLENLMLEFSSRLEGKPRRLETLVACAIFLSLLIAYPKHDKLSRTSQTTSFFQSYITIVRK